MGEVYLAQDTKLNRKVALKIIPAESVADRGRMNRFVQETKGASAFNHRIIITIYEIEQIDSLNFIATEFIDGETLRQRMRSAPIQSSSTSPVQNVERPPGEGGVKVQDVVWQLTESGS